MYVSACRAQSPTCAASWERSPWSTARCWPHPLPPAALKMTVHGLVYDMTAKAAREAALGAGGILHYVTAGRLRRTDLAKIKEIRPNLILIAGGVDYGERDTAIANAEMIRSMNLKIPVVYAGNVENQEEMRLIFPEEEGSSSTLWRMSTPRSTR